LAPQPIDLRSAEKKPETVTPSKIPPIDLRKSAPSKSESSIRGIIFAAPSQEEEVIKFEKSEPAKPEEKPQPVSLPEKKPPERGFDPYREPIE